MHKQTFTYWISGLFVFLFAFSLFFHPLSAFTQDLGRHLKTGEIIVNSGHVPRINLFSYTYPNFPFINHHWFSEVLFYILTHNFGLPVLLFVMAAVGAASLLLVYNQTLNKSKYNLISLFITLLLSGVLLQRLDLRPEIFSFFCVALFVSILYKFRDKPTKWIFILPLIELFWVNVHIYFIIGPLLVGLFLTERLFSSAGRYKFFVVRILHHTWPKGISIAEQEKFHTDLSALLLLLLIFLLTCLATLLNPNFIQGALYPFTVFSNYGYSIEENQSLFTLLNLGFSQSSFLFFYFAVFLLFFALLLNFKKSKLIDWFLASIFTVLAISAVRNFSLFVFAVYIPLVTNLQQVVKQLDVSKKFFIPLVCILCAGLGFWVLRSDISTNGFGFGIPNGAGPGVNFFIHQNLTGPILNNFDIGSYLEYRLYPKEKVFVDGRPEAYPASFFQNVYEPMQENPSIFAQVDSKYHFQTIFFSHTDQTPWAQTFLSTIINNASWKMVYLDPTVVIFVKISEANKPLMALSQSTIVSNTFSFPQDKQSLLQLASVFSIFHWQQAEIRALEKDVAIDPAPCYPLQVLINILTQTNSPTTLIYEGKYQQLCQ